MEEDKKKMVRIGARAKSDGVGQLSVHLGRRMAEIKPVQFGCRF